MTTTAQAIRQAGQAVRLAPWGSQYRVTYDDGSPDSTATDYAQAVAWCRAARVRRVLALTHPATEDPGHLEALVQHHAAQPGRWDDAARAAVLALVRRGEATR